MIINNIAIKQFRGFRNIEFTLGKHLTVITGQNGTQKTTLLGILTQPFSITDSAHPLHGEKPLCGGNFRSSFADKFKLSPEHDSPKNHEWTLTYGAEVHQYTLESIARSVSDSDAIRFWQKGDRSKGSGYLQFPVIYLSLSRLLPIGEDKSLTSSNKHTLTEEEFSFYQEWHNKILLIPDVKMKCVDYLSSNQKNTLGVNTDFYDWRMNSAGQDNIGKILLAILSFKRLKESHTDKYHGGILAIDELDATLYPAAQLKLIEALRTFASKFKIQIIFTTYSLSIIERTCKLQDTNSSIKEQIQVIYLEKHDSNIKVIPGISFEEIKCKLNVVILGKKASKQTIFTEDPESLFVLKALLKYNKHKLSDFQFVKASFSCSQLIQLSEQEIPNFKFPNSFLILDADASREKDKVKKLKKIKNGLILPGKHSPERELAQFLYYSRDELNIWDHKSGYTKQFAFKNFSLQDINDNRENAKKWFNEQKKYWGTSGLRVIRGVD